MFMYEKSVRLCCWSEDWHCTLSFVFLLFTPLYFTLLYFTYSCCTAYLLAGVHAYHNATYSSSNIYPLFSYPPILLSFCPLTILPSHLPFISFFVILSFYLLLSPPLSHQLQKPYLEARSLSLLSL